MKKLIFIFFALIFLAAKPVFTQQPTPTTPIPTATPDPLAEGADAENSAYTLTPKLEEITDTTDVVMVQFNNPDLQSGEFFVCMETDLCIDDDGISDGISEGKQESWDKATLGMEEDKVDEKTIKRYKLVGGKIEVCGDGDTQLKGSKQEYYQGANNEWWSKLEKQNKAGCVPGRDYFHAGKSYILAVYQAPFDDSGIWTLKEVAGFYINHAFPKVILSPTEGLTPGTKFSLKISVDKDKAVNNKSAISRNNYQILIEGPGYRDLRCGPVFQNQSWDIKFPSSNTGMPAGNMKIFVKEQVDEKDSPLIGSVYGTNPVPGGGPNKNTVYNAGLTLDKNLIAIYNKAVPELGIGASEVNPLTLCQGGFVYYQYNCRISSDPKKNSCDPVIADPNKSDIKGLLAYFDKLGAKAANTTFPCSMGGVVVSDPSKCKRLNTAIGALPVDPIAFISRLFSVVLSIAGVGALITIFYSGYRLLISRGDKEMIQKARERLVAAVVGLLFIIFSMALLSIIAVDVLKIPGFG